jgi:hypothetical protein
MSKEEKVAWLLVAAAAGWVAIVAGAAALLTPEPEPCEDVRVGGTAATCTHPQHTIADANDLWIDCDCEETK